MTDARLRELADAHGVATSYTTDRGHRRTVPAETLVAVLAACGVDAATPDAVRTALARLRRRAGRLLPACTVVRVPTGRPPGAAAARLRLPGGSHGWVELADGTARPLVPAAGRGPVPAGEPEEYTVPGLPTGHHTLHAARGDRAESGPLLAVPERVDMPGHRSWGFLIQLYSVLSRRSWGMGDLADLAELAVWSGRSLGAGFVQLGPLHAAEPGPLTDPSPYRPSSRRFPDPMHVRVEAVPEYAYLDGAARSRAQELAARARALNASVLAGDRLIDRDAVRDLKLRALREVYRVPRGPGRQAAFAAFTEREGTALTDFATWCALAGVHGGAWRSWPAPLRDPRSAAVARARAELADEVGFHRWLAWITDEQLAAAQAAAVGAGGMPIGLVHDLAVGVAPEAADSWAFQHCLAAGISVGAPPDDFNPRGQDWGQPPWQPGALAATGYAPYADLLRGALRHAGALRVDHVMGLYRLWWIPEGRSPSEGTYVRYDAEAMLGVLALEAHRAGCFVIGEDLGTVEPGVPEDLARRGFLGTSVQRFEYLGGPAGRHGPLPPDRWRERCLATLTTHDLPTTAAWLSGEHVRLRADLGLLTRPEEAERRDAAAERDGWLAELARLGLLPPDGAAVDGGSSGGGTPDGGPLGGGSPGGGPPEGASPDGAPPGAPAGPDPASRPRSAARAAAGGTPHHPGPPPPDGPSQPHDHRIDALHRFLARTPALLLGVWLPDATGDRRPQNLPGTSDVYPNWRLPVGDAHGTPVPLEELPAAPYISTIARALAPRAPHRTKAEDRDG